MNHTVLKKWIRLLLFIAVFFAITAILNLFVVSPTEDHRFQDAELYANKDTFSVLALGPSDCQNAFDPRVADEMLGKRTFNYGQEGTWYFSGAVEASFNNAMTTQNPDTVIFFVPDYELTDERTAMIEPVESFQNATDGMTNLFAKGLYYYKASREGLAVERLFWARLPDRLKFRTKDELAEIMRLKTQKGYINGDAAWRNEIKPHRPYVGAGYTPRPVQKNKLETGTITAKLGPNAINDHTDAKGYELESMLRRCRNKGIRAVVLISPLYVTRIAEQGYSYADHIDIIKTVALRNGAEFYDPNMIKKEIYRPAVEDWADSDHLNESGARGMTAALCDILNAAQTGEDTADMFYNDLAEYFASYENVVTED